MKTNSKLLLRILLILLIYSWSECMYPKDVDITTAKRVAINWYSERSKKPILDIRITNVIEEKENGETIFYVLTFPEKGFVMVAADDIVQPILGYSITSTYSEENHPPAFEFYILERLKKQIGAAKEAKISPDNETIQEWIYLSKNPEAFQQKDVKSSIPLLTSVWGQGLYFNTLCPADPTDTISGHVPSGCVATAMAQVLNYWQHPWHGTGSHSYTPDDHPEYGVQSADFENTIYNFDNMPDTLSNFSTDVETLIYHCAVSVDMDFGPNGSGAWGWSSTDVEYALENYFYFNDDVEDIDRSSYLVTWVDKMKESLDQNRPVIYAARDNQNDVGHAWVLDAYHEGDMFHCNWGWSGTSDGWYSIDDFSPPGVTFDVAEHASINIYPKSNHINGTWTIAGSPYYISYDHYVDPGDQLIIEPGVEVIFTGRYKLEIQGRLEAIGTITDPISFTSELSHIGMRGIRIINTNNYAADSSKIVYCRIEHGKGHDTDPDPIFETIKGGAIYCSNSSNVLISNSSITNSKAKYGGGIACCDISNIAIKNCLISNDSAGMGGGVYLSYSNATLSNNLIFENECFSNGGGIRCDNSNPTFYQDTIRDNSAHYGGGIGLDDSYVVMDSVIIHDNIAIGGLAGGIHAFESNLELNYVQIFDNTADTSAGGIFCDYNSVMQINNSLIHHNQAPTASSIFIFWANLELNHVTSSSNIADTGEEAIFLNQGTLSLSNSILWNSTIDEIDTVGNCIITASYSNIEDGPWSGNGVISSNPLFEFPYNHNYNLTWDGYPMPDGDKSPCIDSGNPASPLDPDGTIVEMGAIPYEQVFTTLAAGNISGTLTCAGSPYFVDGNLEIPVGEQLIIEPCVYIMFRGYYNFVVRGQILAEGTASDNITFACLDTVTGWKGLRIVNLNSNGQDSSKITFCRISYGNATGAWGSEDGGGIYLNNSSKIRVENCLISNNRSEGEGGGICCWLSSAPVLTNNWFINNRAQKGGGIYFRVNNSISDGLFCNNYADNGGGIYIYGCDSELSGITIRNNSAVFGGGIYQAGGGIPVFNTTDRCSIYLNYAYASGLDIYANPNENDIINIVADSLTVINQHDYFYYPITRFTFDQQNYVVEQEAQDLYVSMTGSDNNLGTSSSDPLKTIHMALKKIMVDELNPRTIYLENGTYSKGATGELLPVNPREFVTISGTDRDETKIYGEEESRLLYGYNDNDFIIQNITLQGGFAQNGGGIYLTNYSSPELNNVKILDCNASSLGGGMYCNEYSSPNIHNSIFINDTAQEGGGLYCRSSSSPQLTEVEFNSNNAGSKGGGIYIYQYNCDIKLDSCLIQNNTATQGGGIYMYQGTENASISNTTIRNNYVEKKIYYGFGGGLVLDNSSPVINNVEIIENTAERYGGGIYSLHISNPVFYNVNISDNISLDRGGGLCISHDGNHKHYNTLISDNTAINGAGIYTDFSSNSVYINVTISGNYCTTGNGGAIYNNGPNTTFLNSIIYDNYPNEIHVTSGSVTAEYCNIEGSWPGAGNIDIYPNFQTLNYRLMSFSPCINAANPDTSGLNIPTIDLDGNPRIVMDTIDMGAYEYQEVVAGFELDLHVLLEGPFNGTNMYSFLRSLSDFPLSQPYFTSPWNYAGTESVASIPTDIVDWILIEIRDAMDAASATSATTVARQAAFLKNDGTIVGMDGSSILFIPHTPVDQLFAVIWHRNHIALMSAYPLVESGGMYSFDFTTAIDQAYSSGQKDLGSGFFGMYAGDANADDLINTLDKTIWTEQAGISGYSSGDYDMDGQVNNLDKNDIWIENNGNSSQIPD